MAKAALLETKHMNEREEASAKRDLRCILGAGLSNQENMVENCLQIASLTGRAHWKCRQFRCACTLKIAVPAFTLFTAGNVAECRCRCM